MLQIAHRTQDLDLMLLTQMYGYDAEESRELAVYLEEVFFSTRGAVYCLWIQDGRYVSALRLEPFADGMVLAGLHTAQSERGKGYGSTLICKAMEWLGNGKVYSHIHHRNRASIAVHQRCGFRLIADHARMLDGTVTSKAGTYLLEIK